jgi:arginyl-tRNA synthetase
MNEIKQLQNLKDNQSIIFQLQSLLATTLQTEFGKETEASSIEVNPTQDEKFGEYTSNVSLKLSKDLGKNPREIAEILVSKLNSDFVEKAEVAGPGFINFFINQSFFLQNLNYINANPDSYGKWELSNELAMVEFGQPNTHKAFHVGHLKSAVTGLALSRMIKNLGYDVIQANYFGDVGMHVAKATWGYMNSTKPENIESMNPHELMKFIDDCYVLGSKRFKEDKDIENEIRHINKLVYKLRTQDNSEPLSEKDQEIYSIYLQTMTWSLEHQADTFQKLGVIYDRQYPESSIANEGVKLVEENIGKVFIEDEGAIIFPGEEYGLNRWVFLTQEKNPTYSGKDLALAHKKFEEFPDLSFNITTTAVEQNSYFLAVIKALELINPQFVGHYYHVGFGWLLRNNKKISSKLGNATKGIELIEEAIAYSKKKISENKSYTEEEGNVIAENVAISGLKFLILSHELHKDTNYDPEQFLNPEGFSGPYVLYGYVRAKSILRQSNLPICQFDSLPIDLNEQELKLIKLLSKYPLIALDAAKTLSPHKIAYYLFEVTQSFNQFYKENKVLVEDENIKNFRLSLTSAVSIVLKNGLDLLGIETTEQM